MKCFFCGHPLDNNLVAFSDECPFCHKPVVRTDQSGRMTFASVLALIAKAGGTALLEDDKKLKSYFADFAPTMTRERKLLRLFLECKGNEILLNAVIRGTPPTPVGAEQIVSKLTSEYSLTESAAREVCTAFLDAIYAIRPQAKGNYVLAVGSENNKRQNETDHRNTPATAVNVADKLQTDKPQKKTFQKKVRMSEGIISAGGSHTVGLKNDGTVISTKYIGDRKNYSGQCEISSWKNIIAISAGGSHTVGLKADGTVISTKYTGDRKNYRGQCEVASWTNIIAISASGQHTVGLKADGTVVSTEYIGNRQYSSPCEISEWKDIVAISATGTHTVGLKADGTVVSTKCGGYFERGQCEVSNWENIIAVSAGFYHTVGLKADGTVISTKYIGDQKDNHGQCEVLNWKDIVAVSAGMFHTVGLKADGTVISTRYTGDRFDNHGQCEIYGWSDIVAVSAGVFHTVGLKANGTLVATKYIGNYYTGACEISGWICGSPNREFSAAERDVRYRNEDMRQPEREFRVYIATLNKEREELQAELSTLKGLFAGMRRSTIEARLLEIESELKRLNQ